MTRVHVVGTGLIGTRSGWPCPRGCRRGPGRPVPRPRARSRPGGGASGDGGEPGLVVVAAPPGRHRGRASPRLEAFPDAVVTDVASVKAPSWRAARRGRRPDPVRRLAPDGRPRAVRPDAAGRPVPGAPLGGRARPAETGPAVSPGPAVARRPVPVPMDADATTPPCRRLARPAGRREPRGRPAARPDEARRAGRSGSAGRHASRGVRPGAVDPDPGGERRRGARGARRAGGRPGRGHRRLDARASRRPGARGAWRAAISEGNAGPPGSRASTAAPTAYAVVTVLVPDAPGSWPGCSRTSAGGSQPRGPAPRARARATGRHGGDLAAAPRSVEHLEAEELTARG